jgi:hypothetical protein
MTSFVASGRSLRMGIEVSGFGSRKIQMFGLTSVVAAAAILGSGRPIPR